MFVTKIFKFDAAHNLINYHGKCEKLHGHTYRLEVTVSGELNEEMMVFDFIQLKELVKNRVLDILDHSYLNELIEQPSAENIAIWVWDRIQGDLKTDKYHLYEIKVYETQNSYVTYRGDGI